jgi:hypothetical protein
MNSFEVSWEQREVGSSTKAILIIHPQPKFREDARTLRYRFREAFPDGPYVARFETLGSVFSIFPRKVAVAIDCGEGEGEAEMEVA